MAKKEKSNLEKAWLYVTGDDFSQKETLGITIATVLGSGGMMAAIVCDTVSDELAHNMVIKEKTKHIEHNATGDFTISVNQNDLKQAHNDIQTVNNIMIGTSSVLLLFALGLAAKGKIKSLMPSNDKAKSLENMDKELS